MQINSKAEINIYLVGKCPVGISPKLGKSHMGMAVGKCPVGILPVKIAPDIGIITGRNCSYFNRQK